MILLTDSGFFNFQLLLSVCFPTFQQSFTKMWKTKKDVSGKTEKFFIVIGKTFP